MVKTRFLLVLLALSLSITGWTGCGQGDDLKRASSSTHQTSGGEAPPASSTTNGSLHQVTQVVHQFLEAVRLGETENASLLLTALALERTRELELSFSPPGSETARFTVGKVEMVDQERAIVQSVWTDLDVDGKPIDEPITWALRLVEGQWRISGMAAEIGSGQPPVVMDFENPQDLMRQEPKTKSAEGSLRQAKQQTRDPFQKTPPR